MFVFFAGLIYVVFSGPIMTGAFGEIKIWSNPNNLPDGWLPCDGRLLNTKDYPDLFKVIGNEFGGDPKNNTFGIPTMRVVGSFKDYTQDNVNWGVSMHAARPTWGSFRVVVKDNSEEGYCASTVFEYNSGKGGSWPMHQQGFPLGKGLYPGTEVNFQKTGYGDDDVRINYFSKIVRKSLYSLTMAQGYSPQCYNFTQTIDVIQPLSCDQDHFDFNAFYQPVIDKKYYTDKVIYVIKAKNHFLESEKPQK